MHEKLVRALRESIDSSSQSDCEFVNSQPLGYAKRYPELVVDYKTLEHRVSNTVRYRKAYSSARFVYYFFNRLHK